MAVINHSKKEINAKIVFFGPSGSGKSSLFRYIHQRIKPSLCGPLKSMPAGGATLLFFDYIPFEHALIDGHKVRFHLYTLSGSVENQGAWKMTLKGVDGLAVVIESGTEETPECRDSMLMLRSVLSSTGRSFDALSSVLLSTKTDQAKPVSDDRWLADLPYLARINSSTVTGEGVLNSIVTLSQGIFRQLQEEYTREQNQESAASETDTDDSFMGGTTGIPSPDSSDAVCQDVVIPEITIAALPKVLKVPVAFDSGGVSRRFVLRIGLSVEEVPGGGDV